LAAVATKYKEIQDLGAEILSVSVDSHFVHKMWQDNELSKMVDGGVPFPMLSDKCVVDSLLTLTALYKP